MNPSSARLPVHTTSMAHVVPMISPPLASEKLASQDSPSVSCDPEVSASAVSDPMIATTTGASSRLSVRASSVPR